jgi:hypothetical protein
MYLFITVAAALMWAAFWGAIRLERTLQEPRLPDRRLPCSGFGAAGDGIAGQDAVELVAGADGELGEDLVQGS